MRKFGKALCLASVLYVTAFLVINPDLCTQSAKGAIELCFSSVIPGLFPFFVCSGLLSALGFSALCSRFLSPVMRPLFNLPGSGAMTFVVGIISGYPVGAATAADLYVSGQCTKTEAERMLSFCNNSGPLFVIGIVGCGFLKNEARGLLLYCSHLMSALLVGVLFRFYGKNNPSSRTLPSYPKATRKTALFSLGEIIDNSLFSTLKICGFIIFFGVFTNILPQNPFLLSFFEITGGLKALTETKSGDLLPLVSFFLAFSGISVMAQVYSIISPSGLSLKPYIWGKLLQGGISFALTKLSLTFFSIPNQVFSPRFSVLVVSPDPLPVFFSSIITALVGAAILSVLMLLLSQEK